MRAARVLKPHEWQRVETPGSEFLSYATPENVSVIVVEDDEGEIVAHVCAINVTHFEGLWIKPEQRGNAGVFRSLIRQTYDVPRVRGERFVLGDAAEDDPRMISVCERLGGKRVGHNFYALPVGA